MRGGIEATARESVPVSVKQERRLTRRRDGATRGKPGNATRMIFVGASPCGCPDRDDLILIFKLCVVAPLRETVLLVLSSCGLLSEGESREGRKIFFDSE